MKIAFLDVETTGLDFKEDKITELGFVIWDSRSAQPVFMYGSLNNPKIPISEDAWKVSGISDDMVRGKKLDHRLIKRELNKVKYIVAHNALFDMSFVIPEFGKEKCVAPEKWLCTRRLIDWENYIPGMRGCRKLTHLASDLGFVNPFAHRALTDALTLLKIVNAEMIKEMITKAGVKWAAVCAVNAGYEKQTELKGQHYSARYENGKFRYWYKIVPDFNMRIETELHFLEKYIYPESTVMHFKGMKSHPASVTYYDHWYKADRWANNGGN